jgi:iron-sulfur cluster repair protein YtfE (RIC family)
VNQIQLTSNQIKSVQEYCKLNNIEDVNGFISKCFTSGFNIEKYGLLGESSEKPVEIEVIKEIRVEVPVEVVKEVIKEVPTPPTEIEVVKYVDREVVKEVKVEVPVEKIVYIYDKKEEEPVTNLDNICDKMEETIFQKEQEILEITQKFSTKMEELTNIFQKEKNELLFKIQQLENQGGQGNKEKMLQQTLVNLKKELSLSFEKIKKLETINEQLKTQQPIGAVFLKGSNLQG